MKRMFFLIFGVSLLLGCGPRAVTPTCIKYPENTTETCTPTYKLLQNKEWVLDSVIFNGQNITAQTLAQVKDYRFVITDQNQNYTGTSDIVLRSQVFFNDSSFEYQYVSSTGHHLDFGISLTSLNEELYTSINQKKRPLLLGLMYLGFFYNSGKNNLGEYTGIRKLESNKLIYGFDNKSKDTIITNYFHSN